MVHAPASRLSIGRLCCLLSLPLLLAAASCAQQSAPAPEPAAPRAARPEPTGRYGEVPGTNLLPASGVRAFQIGGKAERVALSYVDVSGQPFKEALRAEIKERSGNTWDVQVQARVEQAVAAGDVLLATFYLRTESTRAESTEGQTEFVMELARDPWTKSVSHPVRAGREWKQIHVRFKAAQSYAPGEAQLIFRLGYEPQLIEIGGVTVENFGTKLSLSALPTTKITYPGMEPDAPWRAGAAERIEKLRKGELAVTVKDRTGKPVPGAEVSIEMKRSSFGFGSAVVAQALVQPAPNNLKYGQLVPELFNMAVFENNLKWQPLAGEWGAGWTLDVAKQGAAWLEERGLETRGHVLVWPSFRNLPRSVKALEKDPGKLRAAVKQHVKELATAMRGTLVHWDVMNEPFDNHDLMDLLGRDVMVEWYEEARAADPTAKLFINDYAILSGGGGTTSHRDHYEETIRFLLDKGAPLDGIGMQGHFGAALTSPDDLFAILDRYAKFGKQIWVTEFDLDIEDEELAGKYLRDFYTTLFSHPAVGGILMWGFWDGAHWKRNAPLYREDWSLKPAGQVYRELVLRDWRTDVSGKTDPDGSFRTRAFLGRYDIRIANGGQSKTRTVDLTPSSLPVVLSLQ
jgi:GH35 family endo-1,4-beta-xylanase